MSVLTRWTSRRTARALGSLLFLVALLPAAGSGLAGCASAEQQGNAIAGSWANYDGTTIDDKQYWETSFIFQKNGDYEFLAFPEQSGTGMIDEVGTYEVDGRGTLRLQPQSQPARTVKYSIDNRTLTIQGRAFKSVKKL